MLAPIFRREPKFGGLCRIQIVSLLSATQRRRTQRLTAMPPIINILLATTIPTRTKSPIIGSIKPTRGLRSSIATQLSRKTSRFAAPIIALAVWTNLTQKFRWAKLTDYLYAHYLI